MQTSPGKVLKIVIGIIVAIIAITIVKNSIKEEMGGEWPKLEPRVDTSSRTIRVDTRQWTENIPVGHGELELRLDQFNSPVNIRLKSRNGRQVLELPWDELRKEMYENGVWKPDDEESGYGTLEYIQFIKVDQEGHSRFGEIRNFKLR